MEQIPDLEILIESSKSFYLPHHCDLKESNTTTKLRVVFDASAKTTSGVSLYDNLMLGPKVQKDLFEILIRFRFHKVALSADIAKMYRQILLDKENKDFQGLLWKESPLSPLKQTIPNDPQDIWCEICRISCHTTPLTVSRDNQGPCRLYCTEVRHVCRRLAYRN